MFFSPFQTFFLDPFLTKRTFFPADLRAFITTDMEVFAGEHRSDLIDHIFQELEWFFFACTHNDVFNAPDDTGSTLFAFAGQFGISSDSGHFVSREFQFRNNGDKAVCGIFYNILNLFLCIETTVFGSFTFDTFCTDLCQLRIFLDFDTPALIVGQMPVHCIYFE